jgi:hypothetical protein
LDEVSLGGVLGVVAALGLGAGVVAEAFAPDVLAALLEATAGWPDHQSFFARWDDEAFR